MPKQKASKKSQKSAKAAASCKTAICRIVKSQKTAKAAASCKTAWTALQMAKTVKERRQKVARIMAPHSYHFMNNIQHCTDIT